AVTPTCFALAGMRRLLHSCQAVGAGRNPTLRRYRICLSMMDDKPVSRMLAAEVVAAQGEHLLPTKVPLDGDVNKAATYQTPAVLYNPESYFAKALASLAADTIGALGLELSAGPRQSVRTQVNNKTHQLADTVR